MHAKYSAQSLWFWWTAAPTGRAWVAAFHLPLTQSPCSPPPVKCPSEEPVKHQTETTLWQNIKNRSSTQSVYPFASTKYTLPLFLSFTKKKESKGLSLAWSDLQCFAPSNRILAFTTGSISIRRTGLVCNVQWTSYCLKLIREILRSVESNLCTFVSTVKPRQDIAWTNQATTAQGSTGWC